jgi:hypothetical protein
MTCSGNFSSREFFIEKYSVSNTEIQLYQATYYTDATKDPLSKTRKENVIHKIIKKEGDMIYAIPQTEYQIYDFISLNLETNKILFYKTENSKPDLKNRITEKTTISRLGTCNRIN